MIHSCSECSKTCLLDGAAEKWVARNGEAGNWIQKSRLLRNRQETLQPKAIRLKPTNTSISIDGIKRQNN
jgi:hypothetical protein